MKKTFQYDVFISHASEDKESIVFPLVAFLKQLGVKVWYDQFELRVGDSLSRSIDKGLSHSKYGVVVISPSFLKKDWPEYELRGLTSKEVGGEKVILPIWHKVKRETLLEYSPTLADKLSLDTSRNSISEIAFIIIEVVRPDIFANIMRAVIKMENQAKRPLRKMKIKDIKFSPPRHATLPHSLLVRIRIFHRILSEVFDVSFERTVYNFRCDTNPEKEVEVWERITAAYLKATEGKKYNLAKKKDIFSVFLARSLAPFKKGDLAKFDNLSPKEVKELEQLFITKIAEAS